MSSENGRIRVDAADLTLREHAAAVQAAEPFKDHPAAADYVVAGMVWQTRLRTDPSYTYDQALDLKFSDLDIVGAEVVGEVQGVSDGAPPLSSPEPGESVPVT
jgi:hypothetical protein